MKESSNQRQVLIAYNPGVMDPVEESTLKGIKDLGIDKVRSVRTAPVTERQVIWGKFLSATLFLALALALSLYMPALIFLHGKVSLGQIATSGDDSIIALWTSSDMVCWSLRPCL